ncbi:MAG: NADPH:quinone oxidoreductase [Sphingomonadales bacterium BRH_c3]|nr:MAG: NADPH:quinone oxidoreductase [Sphingomonadales bacterium BRH_c3]
MHAWQNTLEWGLEHLEMVELPDPPLPGPGQALVQVHAAASNYRDVTTVTNAFPLGRLPQIPLSDCAGEVIAIGVDTIRVGPGDRVCPTFFRDWLTGPPTNENRLKARGSASTPGVLQERLLINAEELVKIPDHLSYVEAATLPCAAVTAWRALVTCARVRAGMTVVVQGTGGVSLFALQFAKLHGATVILTSSSDAKLERGRTLGADHLINYRDCPEWGQRVLEQTGGRGADIVVEVGGAGTINQSLTAARVGGQICIIGVLGGRTQELAMSAIFGRNLHLHGISVGSRDDFEAMNRAIAASGMRPVIDEVVPFHKAPDALHIQRGGTQFGKICIAFN